MTETTVAVHESPSIDPSADSFRGFEKVFQKEQVQIDEDLKREVAEERRQQVKAMIAGKISNAAWNELIDRARKAATLGEKQFLLLRFPSDLCTDDSRAINNPPNPAWPQTLRGEAADVYNRWHTALRPHGFDLSARVLDFPGGKPGDVGLFLRWDE
ncbi:hypothetical protein [Rhodopila sp.]|uniref:hypothetical protein n=1 Tax=Rhodopila sp. TaxID=2480087 RepID=UPI003D10A09F